MTQTQDFVVEWNDPADAEKTWTLDELHNPEPATPLGGSFAALVSHGFKKAFSEYSVPAVFRQQVIAHRIYGNMGPLDLPPDELGRLMGDVQAKVGGAIAQLDHLWSEVYLPEVKSLIGAQQDVDLGVASIDALTSHWDLSTATARRMMEIHFLAIIPAYVAVSEFDELYRRIFPEASPHESYRLLQGIGNLTVDTGIALWELSRKARDLPEVRGVIETSDEVMSDLESVEGGPAFLADLRAYLDFYGHRGDKWDIAYPSWVEEPAPVIGTLREYLGQDSNPAVELQRAAEERLQAIEDVRGKIASQEDKGAFEFLLAAAETGIVITEDHGFWIDFRGMHQLRRTAVEVGNRLAEAGVIDSLEDVFFLLEDEVSETLRALPDLDRRELVEQRRDSFARAQVTEAPKFVGAPPLSEAPPPNPLELAFGKLFGGPPPAAEGTELRGHPGSPGTTRGTARLITSIADADRLEPGDILVAPATAPPWTPLFAFASAVVTDSGGMLSHCAVVAREYSIPAVVGCGDATTRISDGQTIEVDGNEGVVRIVV